MSEGAASVSRQGVILDANPQLCAMTDRPETELVGADVLDLGTAASRPAFERLLDVEAGHSARGELELAGPGQGSAIPVLLAVSGFDLDGTLVRCLILTDLSTQRATESQVEQAHQALREQHAFLEQAQASAGIGWWIADPRPGGRLTASPLAFQISGLAPEDFDGMTDTFLAFVHPDDASKVADATATALAGHAPFDLEHRIMRRDGTVRWVRQSAIVDRDEAGVPLRMLGICQDITDWKKTEDEIRAAAAYNRSLIEAGVDPIATIGADGTITDVNAAAEQATGYGRDELIGSHYSGYFAEPGLARTGFEQVIRDGRLRDFPLVLRHSDGHTTPVLCNASRYTDPSGHPVGIIASAHDVTAARAAEAALHASRERLSALFDSAPVGIYDMAPGGELVRGQPPLLPDHRLHGRPAAIHADPGDRASGRSRH